jgi:catechol 2,3-dioxygenase-like lactoylglutathione lyase family enzyme
MSAQFPVPSRLVLRGVDHTARPTWKLRETVEFYRDTLGLPLVHVISARGWGPATHPDFLHFFFDSGNGSTIAFFYYLGSDEPASLQGRAQRSPLPEDHVFDATHTAWLVQDVAELRAWKERLESRGLNVSVETTHEVIESIYVRDPNGYFIEFTRKLRPLTAVDATDAALTLQAAMEAEERAAQAGRRVTRIDEVWARKGALLDGERGAGVRLFVPQVEEFAALVRAAHARSTCRVGEAPGYHVIEADAPVEFGRRELGLKPAVWWGLFTGGLHGTIETFDRDHVRIVPQAA